MIHERPDTVYYVTTVNGLPFNKGLYKSLGVIRRMVTRVNNQKLYHLGKTVLRRDVEPLKARVFEGTIVWKEMEMLK
jgi:hypothetical protein